jgi:hypothetical protein
MNTSSRPLGRVAGGLDLYAAALSTLCLIHCLALPLLATLLPLAGQLSETPLVHRALVLLAAPVTLWVVWQSLPVAGLKLFIILALTGLALLFLGAFSDTLSAYEQPITVAGALLLGVGHLWRWVRHRSAARRRGEACVASERSRG